MNTPEQGSQGKHAPEGAPAPAQHAIRVRSLRKRFGPVVAVDDVSLDVPCGAVFGLLGPNGSGKTTLMAMLLGLLQPSSGEIELLGHTGRRALVAARARIGSMIEAPAFYPFLTATQNLRVFRSLLGPPDDGEIERLLDGRRRVWISRIVRGPY